VFTNKKIKFYIAVLVVIAILRFAEIIVGINTYHILDFSLIFVLFIILYHLYSNIKSIEVTGQSIRCVPLALLLMAFILLFVGWVLIQGGITNFDKYGATPLIGGIVFLALGFFSLFESFTMRMTVTKDGILVEYHKILPAIGYLYSFNDLSKIKVTGGFVNLKHKGNILMVKRFIVYHPSILIKEVKKQSTIPI